VSKHINVETQVKDMVALVEALKGLKAEHTVQGKVVSINAKSLGGHGYGGRNIVINCADGSVSLDDMDRRQLNTVKQAYAKVKTTKELKKLGYQVSSSKVSADGTINIVLNKY